MTILFFTVALLASLLGSICGIGGGVIIKPVLDMLEAGSAAQISLMSSCSVLMVSGYSVLSSLHSEEKDFDVHLITPLALGAAAGGVFGSSLFSQIKILLHNSEKIAGVQALILLFLTWLTFLYTLRKNKVRRFTWRHPSVCALLGLILGMLSSFLGIGGGPMNLMVLSLFLSLPSKEAASSSLYIIFVSQLTNISTTILTGNLPNVSLVSILLMAAGGILGGICGRRLNRHLSHQAVDKAFLGAMIVIMAICVFNIIQYL